MEASWTTEEGAAGSYSDGRITSTYRSAIPEEINHMNVTPRDCYSGILHTLIVSMPVGTEPLASDHGIFILHLFCPAAPSTLDRFTSGVRIKAICAAGWAWYCRMYPTARIVGPLSAFIAYGVC